MWVIAIAVIKTTSVRGGIERRGVALKRRIAIRLIWIPGLRPVRVPAKSPAKIAIIIGIIGIII